jgi:TetR/AcrR family transcriptional regulator, cholesterol catabolism regulator
MTDEVKRRVTAVAIALVYKFSERSRSCCTAYPSALARDGPLMLTADHEQRRARIVREAIALALGGYDAVNIRAVAERSDVAQATIYHYFRSKEHLLVTCLHQWLMDFQNATAPDLVGIVDPYDRLLRFVDRLNAALYAMPLFADTVTRAYLFAYATVGDVVEDTRAKVSEMLAGAMGAGYVTRHHLEIGELMTDVWAANVLAVVHRRATPDEMRHRLEVTIDLIKRRRIADAKSS